MEIDSIREVFREETNDLLTQIDHPLMELEKTPDNRELINTVFRALHTIKGSGSMCGYDELANFTHDLENIFDSMRKGEFLPDRKIISLTLRAKDCIRTMLDGNGSGSESELRKSILEDLNRAYEEKLNGEQDRTESGTPVSGEEDAALPGETGSHYKIIFMPAPDIFLKTMKIEPLLSELASLGRCSVRIETGSVPDLDEIEPEKCYLNWIIDLYTERDISAIRDVFIFAEDYSELIIKTGSGFYVNNAFFMKEETGLSGKMYIGSEEQVIPGSGERGILTDRRKTDTSSIRVKNEKLDSLVNIVGELVTLQARLNQESMKSRQPEFVSISEQLGRLTDELRDSTMSIRMVPISETFNGFRRLVYDLSVALGKKIRVVTSGGETELDKNVIEGLRDPLMHLIRNSADHGIEGPDVRKRSGKEESGVISLSAEYSGSSVRITIKDDGAGLNRERIRERAIERELPGAGEYDDRQLLNLIFEPGFSTARVATDISGRGVGMDVVRKNIEKLRGAIRVESVEGEGTTMVLTIPLTLAIIDGFMVDLGGGLFIFNLSNVRECLDFSEASRDEGDGEFIINLRGDVIPCIDLREIFRIDAEVSEFPHIVIIEIEGLRYGFLVDRVIGKYQTVVKPLSKGSRNSEIIAGATILGDGTVALILDAAAIVKGKTDPAAAGRGFFSNCT